MADELLEKVRDALEGQIDFEGQRLAELLSNALLILAGIVAFAVGYITQDISKTLWVGLAGALLAFIVVIPPWPFYNKNPVGWLPSQKGIKGMDVHIDTIKVE